MNALAALAAVLSLLGRHGTLLAALSIFIGLSLPGLAALLKPVLGAVIVGMLTLAFLRVDPKALRRYFTRPGLIAAATIWLMLIAPAITGAIFFYAGFGEAMPGLYFMLVLQLSAPGLMSAPAVAALLGLDVALTLAVLVVSVAITPLTAGLFTHLFLGAALASPLALGLWLALIIAGSAFGAAVIRRFLGAAFIEAQAQRIDGLSVLMFMSFAIAAMDGVTAHLVHDPLLVGKLTGLAFALSLGMTIVTTLVFWPAGRARAFAIGLMAGNRNIGLMLAATGFAVSDIAWLYFAVAQFPIYLLPHLMRPLARWATRP
ncbi:MAG TPA: Na+-dependent transporter [Pseudolabrys sp.]|nr:Na+-dependent transporter [Pseudolabrys sp.]